MQPSMCACVISTSSVACCSDAARATILIATFAARPCAPSSIAWSAALNVRPAWALEVTSTAASAAAAAVAAAAVLAAAVLAAAASVAASSSDSDRGEGEDKGEG